MILVQVARSTTGKISRVRTDVLTKGNPISPFHNKVAVGDKKEGTVGRTVGRLKREYLIHLHSPGG